MTIIDKLIINPQEGGDIVIKTVTEDQNDYEQIRVVAGTDLVINPGYVIINNLRVSNYIESKDIRFHDSDSSNYVGFKAPDVVDSNSVWTLPAQTGEVGQSLSISNSSGELYWKDTVTTSEAIKWAIIFG